MNVVGKRPQPKLANHHHVFANPATIFPRVSKSFVSITSVGECEYRSGHTIATSTEPYRGNTAPSFAPVTSYCPGMLCQFSFQSAVGEQYIRPENVRERRKTSLWKKRDPSKSVFP
jgi:hypothetical protein